MFLAEAGFVCVGFILYISGSSVNLLCSAERLTPNDNLTIRDLRERDAEVYCFGEETNSTEKCKERGIKLQVTGTVRVSDLQVKVFPATDRQTVSLMCSTSCPLTGTSVVYIWYKNGEHLYEDQSPWYQELVSSEEGVRYSCAVKGYEDLRAPEVSVDSVTSTCFTVTYSKGRMCSYQHKSEEEPCSITYPTVEVRVQQTYVQQQPVKLSCKSSCSLTDPQPAFTLYKNRKQVKNPGFTSPRNSPDVFSCAVKGHEGLISAEVCAYDQTCWTVNYVNRRICAPVGSSVNITSEYSQPDNKETKTKHWYKQRSEKEKAEDLTPTAGRVEYHENKKQHILRISKLNKNDSAEYTFRANKDHKGKTSGVTLVVTGFRVKFRPSAVVTEGQSVTLTCISSCPLTDDTVYMWYFNRRPLNLTGKHKHLVMNPVSSEHEGNYSCGVRTNKNNMLTGKTLTVQSISKLSALIAAGVVPVPLVLTSVVVFLLIRRKRSQTSGAEAADKKQQPNPGPVYEDVSVELTEQDDPYYSQVDFIKNHKDPLYSTIQQNQLQGQLHAPYAVVHLKPNVFTK